MKSRSILGEIVLKSGDFCNFLNSSDRETSTFLQKKKLKKNRISIRLLISLVNRSG